AADQPRDEYGRTWGGVVAGMLLVLASRLVESSSSATALFRAGEARADAIVGGEIWRAVTALTLHTDAPHLLSNVVTGTLVATAPAPVLRSRAAQWLLALAALSALGGCWLLAIERISPG